MRLTLLLGAFVCALAACTDANTRDPERSNAGTEGSSMNADAGDSDTSGVVEVESDASAGVGPAGDVGEMLNSLDAQGDASSPSIGLDSADAGPLDDSSDEEAGPEGVAPEDFCASIGAPLRDFEVEGDFGTGRHQKAADFSFPHFDGTTWTLSESWTGCDSYIFIGSARTNSGLDDTSVWVRDLLTLVQISAPNVHYFFVPTRSADEAMAELSAMQAQVDEVLAELSAEEALHWSQRLHVAGGHVTQLGSWLATLLGSGYGGYYGAAIDRRQEVRYMGNFADVARYSQALSDAGEWMWEENLAYAAYEAQYFDYEVARDAYLASQVGATVIRPLDKEVFGGQREVELSLPDAETMATFDTLEFDLHMDCPDPAGGEFGNCGAWDYLAYVYLQEVDEAGEVTWRELARFITTYHREGRYLVDASPMLVYLAEGGTRTLKVDVSGQSYLTTLDVRLFNAAKPLKPVAAHYLFDGGGFGSTYSDKYSPIEVAIPESAAKVELWTIVTGHGMGTYNCAEFCDHRHTFTVNGEYFQEGHPEVNNQSGCVDEIVNGVVPNQGGTWWFGRGGWCPGQQVEPWTADVSDVVVPGETATISYQGTLGSLTPPDGAGNIRMVSYLVIYE